MKQESIITPIYDRHQPINEHIAGIEGRRYLKRPTFYRNTISGQEYFANLISFVQN